MIHRVILLYNSCLRTIRLICKLYLWLYYFLLHKQFTKLEPYLLKERVAVGMLMGDNRWAGLRSLNGLDFVNPPLNLILYNYNSQKRAFIQQSIVPFVLLYCTRHEVVSSSILYQVKRKAFFTSSLFPQKF